MDIDYLLVLQNFREGIGGIFAPFLSWMSKFAISFWPLAMMCMLYWVLDRKGGKRILAGFGMGLLVNGFLKLVFCVYRPWIRDARVEPYGDSKVAATGYSFPSGHSTWATGAFGGIGFWMYKHRQKLCAVILCVAMVLTLFSRNYLGVHTPQDVVVGFAATALMMFLAARIEAWTDKNPKRDYIILVAGIILCIVLMLFYQFKGYPMTYLEDGSLLVDPAKMKADSFEGIGFIFSFVICRYFERRGFDFEKEIDWKNRFIIGIFALIPLCFWVTVCAPFIMTSINRSVGRFAGQAFIVVYTMIIVPQCMKRIRIPQSIRQK